LQHFVTFALLMMPIYSVLLSVIALADHFSRKLLTSSMLRMALVPVAATILLIFADNLLRATAALIALDERVRIRRFISWRVFWRLVKALPTLALTQARSMFLFGSGWLIGDCLWPVLCVVEKISGRAAVLRSRNLMAGLNSAGRALAIRHVALAVLAIAEVMESVSFHWGSGRADHSNTTTTAVWFPIFAVFAAAPLFLYDRTAAQKEGPLLQLNRTPEIRITARPLTVSSMVWLAIVTLYLIYEPLKLWFFGAR